jgi:creatinine amidohydrolase
MPTVEYDKMFVADLRDVLRDKPVAYLPLGTPEMHGEHLTLGQDGIKAHELCKRMAEAGGGAVLPALHVGTHVPTSFNFGNIYVSASLARELYRQYMQELARVGFRVILAVTGHYPSCQVSVVKQAAADAMDVTGAWVVGLDECELALDAGYTGDHAGKWETSIYWHLRPDLVRMENLPADLEVSLVAAGPEDPRVHASPELGEEVCGLVVERMVAFADRLLAFDADPVQHGPTHTMMRNALRAMARAHEDRTKGNPRAIPEYQEAAALFYGGQFGAVAGALARVWEL